MFKSSYIANGMNVEIIRVLGKECQLVTQKAEAVIPGVSLPS